MLLLVVLLILVIVAFVIRAKYFGNILKKIDGTEGPSTSIWDFIKWRRLTGRGKHSIMFETAKAKAELGKIYTFYLGPVQMITIADAELAKKIFLDWGIYQKATFAKISPTLSEYMGKNIVFQNGDDWRRHRKLMDPAFIKLDKFLDVFVNHSKVCLSHLEKEANEHAGSVKVPFWMQRFALDVLGECIFGYNFDYMSGKPSKHLTAYEAFFRGMTNAYRLFIPFYRKLPLEANREFEDSMKGLDDLVYSLIDQSMQKQSKQASTRNSLLDVLIDSCGDDTGLNKKELHDNIIILFLAGHETSASSLSFTCYELANNPQVQEDVFKEIQSVFGDSIPSSSEKISECRLLGAVLKEVMRMHAPVASIPPRTLEKDQILGDFVIPANSIIRINVYAIHHDEAYWKEPFKFRPERFLNEESKTRPASAYLPFGGGPRLCIGNNFSLLEQKVFLIMLLQKYRLELDSQDIEYAKGGIMRPTDNNFVRLVKRH